jgi:prevent-host-death family protein
MDRIGAAELNQNTSQVLARVSRGETIEITDHGYPVARLVPAAENLSTLARLVATGRAVAPTSSGPVPLPPQLGDRAVDAASDLAAVRSEDRW